MNRKKAKKQNRVLKKERKNNIRKIKKTLRGRIILKLKCKFCKKIFFIRVNNEDIYTEKVIKNWKCGICK